jgi:DNA-3-methyladenine glycosylase
MEDILNSLEAGAEFGARALLGWKLVYQSPEGRTAGIIVETEAYTEDDPASHTFGGLSMRNAAMYEEAGTIYVYLIYGLHSCVNIVSGRKGVGEAVLIRALEPTEGIELMRQRRGRNDNLTNGPAKLVQAMGILSSDNGTAFGQGALQIEPGIVPGVIHVSTRIGIARGVGSLRRYYIADNPHISTHKR